MGSVLAPFVIMLREGLEAALIVGVVATYLGQTGRRAWMPVVGVGIGLAVALALYVGAALQWLAAEFPQKQQELFEGVVGLLAVGMLTYMVFWMSRHAHALGAQLRGAVDLATGHGRGAGGAWALVGMVFLAVAREGLESVFFLLALFQQSPGWQGPAAALAGVAVAAVAGVLIYRGGLRLDLRRFFSWTAVLILFVAAGLLAGSLRKLHEAGVWNLGQQVVADWSALLPMDSVAGAVLSGLLGYQAAPVLSEALVYAGFLLLCGGLLWWRQRPRAAKRRTSDQASAIPAAATSSARVSARDPAPASGGSPPAPRGWAALLGLTALLVLSGLYAFHAASTRPRAAGGSDEPVVTVTIRDMRCVPADITVPAGRTRFVIVNESNRALEWEILDGIMVVDERENITPGMSRSLSVRLSPGEFEITCGLLNSPRGKLRVLPSAASEQRARAPQLVDFVGVLAEYRVYSLLQLGDAADAADQLLAALDAGDRDEAWRQLAQADEAYQRMAPAVESLADLNAQFNTSPSAPSSAQPNAREGITGLQPGLPPGVSSQDRAQREPAPAFTVWPAVADALRQADAVAAPEAGLARARALAVQAADDLGALNGRLRGLALSPRQLLLGTAAALRRGASRPQAPDSPVPDELAQAGERGLQAGAEKVLDLFQPVLGAAHPAPLEAARQALAAWREEPDGRDASAQAGRRAQMNTLADALARLERDSGLDVLTPTPETDKAGVAGRPVP